MVEQRSCKAQVEGSSPFGGLLFFKSPWSSSYDVALTWRRSQVQFLLGSFFRNLYIFIFINKPSSLNIFNQDLSQLKIAINRAKDRQHKLATQNFLKLMQTKCIYVTLVHFMMTSTIEQIIAFLIDYQVVS